MTMKETRKNSTCQYCSWQKQQQQRDILQNGQYYSPKDQEGHLAKGLMYLAEGGPENGHPIEVLLLGLETPGDPEVLLSV